MLKSDTTLEAVARILAVTVLLDRRQKDREMVELCHSLMTINRQLRPDVILPKETILDWYETQKDAISEALAHDEDDTYKVRVLEKITDPEQRKTVLASIFAICICDYEFQDEEAAFIKIALRVWESGLPNANEMVLMAG